MASLKGLRFGSHLKELRIHLCQTAESSKGVRDFVEKLYVPLKLNNPKFPILIRECSGIEPKVWARFAFGRENSISLSGLSKEQVLQKVEILASKPA